MPLHHQQPLHFPTPGASSTMENLPTTPNMPPLADDEQLAEVDEPPDGRKQSAASASSTSGRSSISSGFEKTRQMLCPRRESLLTQSLKHDENTMPAHVNSDKPQEPSPFLLSTFTWSTASSGSVAELTSDDGLTSPGLRTSSPSPPLPPEATYQLPQVPSKPLNSSVPMEQLQSEAAVPVAPAETTKAPSEKTVEAALGRKRCIQFACGAKKDSAPSDATPASTKSTPTPAPEKAAEPPKRACALRFVCPTRDSRPAEPDSVSPKDTRPATPVPTKAQVGRPILKTSPPSNHEADDTVRVKSTKPADEPASNNAKRRPTEEELGHTAATTFHEFASSEEEEEEWLNESTCHKSRLTLSDTLTKENAIRKLGQEAEEEAELDEDDLDGKDNEDEEDVDDDDDDVADSQILGTPEDEDESDDGFHSDDENGFASSDDESEVDSEYAWWVTGPSTAAISTDQVDHLRPISRRRDSGSSIGSFRPGHVRYLSRGRKANSEMRHNMAKPMNIRPVTPELPDSTDFVCGTLDEDRPLEEAYYRRREQRKAAKHKLTPQDIDPSFPVSDPEMEEEDEDDEPDEAAEESDYPFMHGQPDFNEADMRGRSVREWRRQSTRDSPKQLRSPPPSILKRSSIHRSPPPPVQRNRYRSPPPPTSLFGHSPRRLRSPLPTRLRSPPPSRRSSYIGPKPEQGYAAQRQKAATISLAQRPQPTHTASLPRTPFPTTTGADLFGEAVHAEDDDTTPLAQGNRRGAIDIVKGLEKKRQRRKEKLYQKHCNRANKQPEKKCKPGKGCEKMREVGLEMAAYRGKGYVPTAFGLGQEEGEHILSV